MVLVLCSYPAMKRKYTKFFSRDVFIISNRTVTKTYNERLCLPLADAGARLMEVQCPGSDGTAA